MPVTFAVDAVAPVLDRLPTVPLSTRVPDALAFAHDRELAVVDHGSTHALLGAVHLAFAQHRPLVLTPDAVWLTIAQGVAHHVRINAEHLRSRLVRHAGTQALEIKVGEVPTDAAGWAEVVPQFRDTLAARVGDGRARLLECDFSTTTAIDRVASQIVLMDLYAPYFDYWMTCVCGIPSITLTGTVDDWRSIRSRIDVIAELDLETWARSLAPIADHFIRAAEGTPDTRFWQRIYKPADAYGGEVVTGWIARLYPYLIAGGSAEFVNPLLARPLDEPKDTGHWPPGVPTDSVIAGPCSVRVNIAGLHDTSAVQLDAGVTIVVQDVEGRLVPQSTWALRPSHTAVQDVVLRIKAAHPHVPAESNKLRGGPAEIVGFFNLLSSAQLGDWRVLPPEDHRSIEIPSKLDIDAARVIEGPGDRFIGYALIWGDTYWLLFDPTSQTVDDVPIIGTRLTDVLDAILDTGSPPPGQGRLGDVVAKANIRVQAILDEAGIKR